MLSCVPALLAPLCRTEEVIELQVPPDSGNGSANAGASANADCVLACMPSKMIDLPLQQCNFTCRACTTQEQLCKMFQRLSEGLFQPCDHHAVY